uniref:Uncharacterized protein n=1 Tax=Engystomops pustulosus TaxID=76066 RepID=A0AAV6Z6S5_ENGPU|nr:hypothetical protein GDO81_025547 [Engystomops pustulosus]
MAGLGTWRVGVEGVAVMVLVLVVDAGLVTSPYSLLVLLGRGKTQEATGSPGPGTLQPGGSVQDLPKPSSTSAQCHQQDHPSFSTKTTLWALTLTLPPWICSSTLDLLLGQTIGKSWSSEEASPDSALQICIHLR